MKSAIGEFEIRNWGLEIEKSRTREEKKMTLFEEYIKPEKKAILVPREVPILDLHYLYAYLLVEKDRLHDAEDHLQRQCLCLN